MMWGFEPSDSAILTTWISTYEITKLRCDLVVEYPYEWNGLNVWGRTYDRSATSSPTHHDVSYTAYASEHNNLGNNQPWVEVSPEVQRANAQCTQCDPHDYSTLRKE